MLYIYVDISKYIYIYIYEDEFYKIYRCGNSVQILTGAGAKCISTSPGAQGHLGTPGMAKSASSSSPNAPQIGRARRSVVTWRLQALAETSRFA